MDHPGASSPDSADAARAGPFDRWAVPRAQALAAALWVYAQLAEEERRLVVDQYLISQKEET